MRPLPEIQRAHDLLAGIVDGEVDIGLVDSHLLAARSACDVLCWVLEHIHNRAFECNLEKIEFELRRRHIVLTPRPPGE